MLCLHFIPIQDSLLVLRSEKNVTLNARNHQGQLTGQLTVGEFPVSANYYSSSTWLNINIVTFNKLELMLKCPLISVTQFTNWNPIFIYFCDFYFLQLIKTQLNFLD